MELLSLVIISSLTVALATALSHPALRASVSGALGVVLALTLLSPLVSLVSDIADGGVILPDFSTEGEGGFEEITLAAFEEGIATALLERYGDSLSGVGVRARGFDPTDMRADGLTVVLPAGAGGLDYRAIRDYLDENFTRGGGTEVFYG